MLLDLKWFASGKLKQFLHRYQQRFSHTRSICRQFGFLPLLDSFGHTFTKIRELLKNHFLVIETQNNSRFSITHTYINTINYHFYIGMHHRISKQRVPSHLNTKSRLLHVRKYKKHRLNYAI